MRIDIVTIFPDFFKVLDLSLLGKAKEKELLQLQVHDLRDKTEDLHKTVDDAPYGGGAGMVMMPEPWGKALDSALQTELDPVLIFPSPAGEVFNQKMAHELSAEQQLVFACGRYEGIDQRVVDHFSTKVRVRLISLGDYVLNGGEVATVAFIEAIARLIPGMVGNPESLVEESHESGLLEYPSFTRPKLWRDLEVPEVLLSGNHRAIENWRLDQRIERTKQVRPELYQEYLEKTKNPSKD